MKWFIFIAADIVIVGVVLLIPLGGGPVAEEPVRLEGEPLDLAAISPAPPAAPLDLLFIHHSCGGHLMAGPGPQAGEKCIYATHPAGGSLRRLLEEQGYRVHEASYGSAVGQATDIFDWPPKFRDQMARVLACRHQDEALPDGRTNRVVLFKSCFPNNAFAGEGADPGDPAGPELTVANAKAAYRALLPEFARRPGVLFVCLTAPPLAPGRPRERIWRKLARLARGREEPGLALARSGVLARRFNGWLADRNGWLKDYPGANVAVFDLYHLLTGRGESNLSRYATRDGLDSHPSREGNELAARELVPFLNRAVRRAGLSE